MMKRKILLFVLMLSTLIISCLNVSSDYIVEPIGDNNGADASTRYMTRNSTGSLFALYIEDNSSLYFEKSDDDGATWTGRTFLHGAVINDCDIVVDSNDKIYVCYAYAANMFATESTDSGASWSTAQVIYNAVGGDIFKAMAMTMDSNDNPYIAFVGGYGSGWTVNVIEYNSVGGYWMHYNETSVPFNIEKDYCDVVALSNGSLMIAYTERTISPRSCFYTFYIPGTNTSTSRVLIYTHTGVAYFEMLVDTSNVVHIVYRYKYVGGGGNQGIFYRTITNGVVSAETTIRNTNSRKSNTITYTTSGNIYILTSSVTPPTSIGVYIKEPGQVWSGEYEMNVDDNVSDPNILYQRYPSTCIMSDGFRFNYYNDTSNNYCYGNSSLFTWGASNITIPAPGGTYNAPNITLNVYNESNASQNVSFNVFITNPSGSSTYYETGCTNPHYLNYSLIPTGDRISFLISNSSYYSRQFYIDIDTTVSYVINVYLATLSANLYFMNVIDEYGEPVEDALLTVQRYINETSGYENMTSLYTDGAGQCSAYLLPNVEYKVLINKTGFYDKIDDYIPDPTYYGIYYPKTFRIYYIDYEVDIEYDFWEYITFNGTMYSNGTINVNYVDSLDGTNSAIFYTYSIYNDTSTLISTNTSYASNISFWIRNVNTTRYHRVVLYYQHSVLGNGNVSIMIGPVNYTDNINETDIEEKFTDVFGDFDPGYVTFFFIYLPAIVLLVLPAASHPGIGVAGAGLWLGWSGIYFGGAAILVVLAPFLIAIGVMLVVAKGGAAKL